MVRKNVTTFNNSYLLEENRDSFDKVKRGDLELQIAARTGNQYTNFSNKFNVVEAPKDGKYKVGDVVWGHHFILDQTAYDGLFYANEEQIWFKGNTLLEVNDENIVVFVPYLHEEIERPSGIVVISYDSSNEHTYGDRGKVVSGGGLPVGSEIYYLKNRDYELWENEIMYFVVDKDFVCMVNGEPFGEWYVTKVINDTDLYFSHDIRLPRGGVIALLQNPNLPYDGKYGLLSRRPSQSFVSPDKILGIVDLPSNVSLSNEIGLVGIEP